MRACAPLRFFSVAFAALCLSGALRAQAPYDYSPQSQGQPRLLYRSPDVAPLLDRHYDTSLTVASLSGRVYSLSAQGWESPTGNRSKDTAYLVFHRPGMAPFAVRIGANLWCAICREGGTLVEPEQDQRFRVRVERTQSDEDPDEDRKLYYKLTVKPDGGDDKMSKTFTILELFQYTAAAGSRFRAPSERFGSIDGSLVFYKAFHDPVGEPSIAVFFGEPVNSVKPVALSGIPRCADRQAQPQESDLLADVFRRRNWRIGLRLCGASVEVYELPPPGAPAFRPDGASAYEWPALEELRRNRDRPLDLYKNRS